MANRETELRLRKFEREALAHLDALLRAAKGIARNSQDAEDITQETYLRAWKYFDSFDAGSNCRGWLFRIMFNVINGRRSKQMKLAEMPFEESPEHQRDNVIAFDPLRRIEGREVIEAASQLSEEHRSVLWLVIVEEFTYREAAEALDVPIGTVMSRLHRARIELRKLLAANRASGLSG
ncbi:MAG TPA: sigma-70 family RNA polymerase sigma factor [Blastocatellia bacterium]|nr:sigma-70 family RNA polymerase sigma factor [Blastocatellia bacterium]